MGTVCEAFLSGNGEVTWCEIGIVIELTKPDFDNRIIMKAITRNQRVIDILRERRVSYDTKEKNKGRGKEAEPD